MTGRPAPPALGARAPDFSLPDEKGTTQTLSRLVAEQPRVLVFYRGHW